MPPGEESDRNWLVKPLGTEELRVHVDIGEGVEVSEETRAALDVLLEELYADEVPSGLREGLDTLVSELYADEVEGFAIAARGNCDPWYECFLRKCQPHYSSPCFVDSVCKITRIA